jgi:hypothetical protein
MERPSDPIVLLIISALIITSALILPYVIWPNYGQTPYYINPTAVDDSTNVSESDIISYNDLPPAAQESFDKPDPNYSQPMYYDRDREAIKILNEKQYVEHEGRLYRVSLVHGDGAWIYLTLGRFAMFLLGGISATIGIIAYILDKMRKPRTTDS